MPVHLRSTALTAALCGDTGIRVYTKTKDGDVREGCNNTTAYELSFAYQLDDTDVIDHGSGWFPGELCFSCSPDSTLCAIVFEEPVWELSVFYQTKDGCIREKRHKPAGWEDAPFFQPGCMMGTNIAVVCSELQHGTVGWPQGKTGWYGFLFFQDDEGYLCYRDGNGPQWGPKVRLQKAAKCTGIGATAWNDCREVRVYFQDEENVVREYHGGRDISWSLGRPVHECNIPIGDISAVSWQYNGRTNIRLYFQEEDCNIIEYCLQPNGGWTRGGFRYAALPNSDVVTYVRRVGNDGQICVMWAGEDQILWQKVCMRINSNPQWLKETPIAFLQATGRFYGSWTGTPFTDNSSRVDRKVIRQLDIRSGLYIDGLALEFTDGTSTAWHGGQGGHEDSYKLQAGEDFTHIRVSANESYILGLQFITSHGRETPWYGSTSGAPYSWELDGRALAGFMGSTGQYVCGLMPFWSERFSTATLDNLQDCIEEGKRIHGEIELASRRCAQLRYQTEQLQRDIEDKLRPPANRAIHGVSILCGTIEELYEATMRSVVLQSEEMRQLVGLCKGQAVVVEKRFKCLYGEANQLTKRAGDLSIELTAKLGESEARSARLGNLQTVADGLQKGAEVRAETMEEQRQTAAESMRKARETQREAESKRREAEAARIVRDIFTFGLGRLGDWFGLDEAVRYANRLVQSCQRNIDRAQQDLQDAQHALSNIRTEMNKFLQLHSSLDTYKLDIQNTAHLAIVLRERNMQLQNTAFDISLFLAALAAKSETVKTNLTAAQFARAILDLQQTLLTSTKVKGLILDAPQRLESMMELIAQSDEVARVLSDNDLV